MITTRRNNVTPYTLLIHGARSPCLIRSCRRPAPEIWISGAGPLCIEPCPPRRNGSLLHELEHTSEPGDELDLSGAFPTKVLCGDRHTVR